MYCRVVLEKKKAKAKQVRKIEGFLSQIIRAPSLNVLRCDLL
jgi:hypothetical protein